MSCYGFRLRLPIVASILCVSLLAPAGRAKEPETRAPATQAKPASPKPPPEGFTEEELTTLGQRAEDPDEKVVGGSLSNQELTYIVIALAVAVIVLIIVAA